MKRNLPREKKRDTIMRPDNPNFLPCATYNQKLYRASSHEDKEEAVDDKGIGYDAVGPGWHDILAELDHQFVQITGLGTKNHTKIKILQIKEKFGGLRVYYDPSALREGQEELAYRALCARLGNAVREAEDQSFQTCEKCGSKEGVETRGKKGASFGRTLTLCQEHLEERDNLPNTEWFQLGNGDKTV